MARDKLLQEKEPKKQSKPFNLDTETGSHRNGMLTWYGKVLGLGDPLAADIKMNAISGKA